MTHDPRLPREQRSFADTGARAAAEPGLADRGDLDTGASAGQTGEADPKAESRERFGTLKHNLTNQWKVQDR